MTISSGLIPYNYDNTTPIRGRVNDQPIAPSGSMIEQGQFVVTAELRKWLKLNNSHELPTFRSYQHVNIPPSDPYEPNATGNNLNRIANMSMTPHVIETRRALEKLFRLYTDDSVYSSGEHHADWIHQAYPESLSGQIIIVGEPDDTYPGWTRRESVSGFISTADINVLGGSGQYVDLDFGEVMFNPYPFAAKNIYARSSRQESNTTATSPPFSLFKGKISYPIAASPFFPSFQKTNGSVITLSGREVNIPSGNNCYNIDHISSGYVRFDGYGIDANTEYLLQRSDSAISSVSDFTHGVEGTRLVGLSGIDVPQCRAFLTPKAQSSGVYKIRLRNQNLNTVVPSGGISLWPHPSGTWANRAVLNDAAGRTSLDMHSQPIFTSLSEGYEVFDDAFGLTTTSGLLLISPFIGRPVWHLFSDESASTFDNNLPWGSNISNGIAQIGTDFYLTNSDIIVDTSSPFGYTISLEKYNSDLDYIGNVTVGTIDNFIDSGTAVAVDTASDRASSIFVVMVDTFSDRGIVEANTAGTLLNLYKFGGTITNLSYFTSTFYTFAEPSSGISEVTFTPDTLPDFGDYAIGTPKNINGAPIVGNITPFFINRLYEVENATHIADGFWALCSAGSNQYLFKIEEAASTWEITSYLRLDTRGNIIGIEIPRNFVVINIP